MVTRKNARGLNEIRKIEYLHSPFGYADASLFYEQGGTKIFVCVGLSQGVPRFLKGQGKGWLTAEYSMHPYAGERNRSNREFFPNGRDYRSVEISRFIGRCFRSVVDLAKLGERTVFLDCDVMQADGGTRVACINALSLALSIAEERWLSERKIFNAIMKQKIFAISVGRLNGATLLDLDKEEDNKVSADFNFVMTADKQVVEVQGTAETSPLSWPDFDLCRQAAEQGIDQILKNLS